MDAHLLVQKKNRVDPVNAIHFAEKHDKTRLLLILSSIEDEEENKNYFSCLTGKLSTPFIGLKTSGFLTPKEGYCEDSVAVIALCGDFSARIFHESPDRQNQENTSKDAVNKLREADLCLAYCATSSKNLSILDAIFRRIRKANKKLKIFGSLCAPKPLVSTNEGTYEEQVVCAAISGLKSSSDIISGFAPDPYRREEYTITKSDEYNICEIDSKNAAEEYSKIQRMRPYFFNTIMDLLEKTDFLCRRGKIHKANPHIHLGVMKSCNNILGEESAKGGIEPLVVYRINQEMGCITPGNYRPAGTKLRRIITSKESQLAAYEKIIDNSAKDSFTLIDSCSNTGFWMESEYEPLREKLKKLGHACLLSFSPALIGINKGENLTHNCSMGALHLF